MGWRASEGNTRDSVWPALGQTLHTGDTMDAISIDAISRRSRSRRHTLLDPSILLFVLGTMGIVGCASTGGHSNAAHPSAMFTFENSTVDQVAVYLDDQHSQWLLGFAEPGRRTHLRLPAYFGSSHHTDVAIMVVPVGTRRDGVLVREMSGTIRSEPILTEELSSMQWVLRSRQLISSVPPRGRR